MVRAAILTSGEGTLFQSVLDAMFFGEIPDFELVGVITTKENAYTARRAANAGVCLFTVEPEDFPTLLSYSMAISNKLKDMTLTLSFPPASTSPSALFRRSSASASSAFTPHLSPPLPTAWRIPCVRRSKEAVRSRVRRRILPTLTEG